MRHVSSTIIRFLPLLAAATAAFAARPANGQVDFFNRAGTAYEPEISVVNSGAILDAQAVVSADRKYVTLNMRASNTNLLALQEFSFASGRGREPLGFVGGAGAAARAAAGGEPEGSKTATAVRRSPRETRMAAESILERPGMTRID